MRVAKFLRHAHQKMSGGFCCDFALSAYFPSLSLIRPMTTGENRVAAPRIG